ncbi:type III pantothenate kinase [Sulfurovum sp. bin170]|uniref:type III pantothenate kinase n=1 Tax=Sulfurovum sp. bin170 TaxID=2695268 RepID=UPI0013DF68FE|nr:type III pantothenate kinase [Sulfurovum sp. bin170]NEW59729.1 type III pantothenate kinase [Sulfurovum sp. bin170]
MLLADIGNTRIHIYNGKEVIHLSHQEAIEQYADKKLKYITVKHQLKERLNSLKNWTDISDKIRIKNEYETMGIDRKALCLSYPNGIFVSAGTAITVDVVEEGVYQGGFLLLGLRAYIDAYASISPALKIELDREIDLNLLPVGTRDGISYGILNSIKAIINILQNFLESEASAPNITRLKPSFPNFERGLIDKHKNTKQLYITGGDGKFLSSFFEGAIFDERLIFLGMQRSLI